MKNLLLALFLAFPILTFGQSQEKHAQISLTIDRPDLIPYLNDNGMEIDHFHKSGKNQLEVILSQSKVDALSKLGVDFEIVTPDVAAHFESMTSQTQGPEKNMDCGLLNFDSGSMGGYHTYDDIQIHIFSMATQYPDLVQIIEIGSSLEGRTIFAVKISDNVLVDESDVEGVAYFDALTHAREPISMETTLFYMWTLLENYGSDDEFTYLINNREMYFVPVVNPDGYVYNQSTNPNGGGLWRKNRRPHGNGCVGVDLNRNYGYAWATVGSSNDPCSNIHHGAEAFSEPESQAVRDFTNMIEPVTAFSIHTSGDVILTTNFLDDPLLNYELYAEYASEFIPEEYKGYGLGIDMINYTSSGNTRDYLNSNGTVAYTPELGHTFWEPSSAICDRVQEFMPALKFMTWAAGDFTCFHDFEILDDNPLWLNYPKTLMVRVKNRGNSITAQNVSVALSSSHPAINFLTNTANLGDVAPRAYADNFDVPFEFTVSGDLAAGEQIAINVTVYQGSDVSYEDVIYLYAGEQNVLLEEDCEGDMSQWESSGNVDWGTSTMDAFGADQSMGDSPLGNFSPSANNYIELVGNIDLSEAENPWLEFNAKWSLEANFDLIEILASIDDGNSWINMQGLYTDIYNQGIGYSNNQHWVQERIDLSVFSGEASVKIGFFLSADFGVNSDGFYFDDLKIVDYLEAPTTATTEFENNLAFEVFPNPVSNELTISLGESSTSFEMILMDVQGRIVLKAEGFEQSTFSSKEVPSGIYTLQVLSDNLLGMEKVVVVRD